MKSIAKHGVLFLIGGAIYIFIELAFRGRSHWTMFLMGGLLFIAIGQMNEGFTWEMPLLLQGAIGGVMITGAELVAGLILNVWLGLGIWDYSNLPLNLWGQISLPFSLAWVGLAMVAVIIDDYLRYWLFGEEKPHYRII